MNYRLVHTPGTRGSASLKLLAAALSASKGRKVFRSTQPRANRINLMYGQGVDKLTQYRWFEQQGLSALEYTTETETAMGWAVMGNTVFGRKYLNSSCGKGIVVFDESTAAAVHGCPVYTKYKKKKREFRVHVFKNEVVAVTEKRRRSGFEGTRDTKIRNLENGYVFCQSVENEPAGLRELALRAAQVSPSHFRGVDIGFNEHNNDLFVIEVNSAPGVAGSNISRYVDAILAENT